MKMHESIRRWHWGKLLMVWAIGTIIVWALVEFFNQPVPKNLDPVVEKVIALGALGVVVIVSIAVVVITWKWLSAKEKQ